MAEASNTYERRPMVLVAGIGRGPYDALAPVLARQKLEVYRVSTPEKAIKLARGEKCALVILHAEPTIMTLEEVVDEIRAEGSASGRSSVLVLAEPDRVEGPLELVGRGVNRVMLHTDPPELIGQQAALLMNIAPRATMRLSTRMLVEVADGCEEALGAVVNLSSTGLLVETDTDFEPGQHIVLTISLLDDSEPLSVKAEVVRQAHPERDGVEGIGARFLSFADDSRERLEAVLGKAFETTNS